MKCQVSTRKLPLVDLARCVPYPWSGVSKPFYENPHGIPTQIPHEELVVNVKFNILIVYFKVDAPVRIKTSHDRPITIVSKTKGSKTGVLFGGQTWGNKMGTFLFALTALSSSKVVALPTSSEVDTVLKFNPSEHVLYSGMRWISSRWITMDHHILFFFLIFQQFFVR